MKNLKIQVPLTLNKSVKKQEYSIKYIYDNFYKKRVIFTTSNKNK